MTECTECGSTAECAVPRAPGMGNDYYCSDCCPRCNIVTGTGGDQE